MFGIKRLFLCLKFCKGVSNKQLQSFISLKTCAEATAKLHFANKDYLEALHRIADWNKGPDLSDLPEPKSAEMARTVIFKQMGLIPNERNESSASPSNDQNQHA